MHLHHSRGLALAALLALPAAAQVPTVLLSEGDAIDVEGNAQTIYHLGGTATNAVAGRAVSVGTSGPLGTLDLVWGSTRGGADAVIQREGDFGNWRQAAYDDRIGVSAFAAAYAATCQSLITLQTGHRVVWHGGLPMAPTGNFAPATIGGHWRTIDEVGVRANGRRWFRAALSDSPGGSITRRGFFAELPNGNIEALVMTGESYPGMPAAIANGGARHGASMSPLGTNWIAPVFVLLGSGADKAMMMNGAALQVGGETVHQSAFIPASAGGNGDRWDDFSYAGIDDAGRWFFAGESSGSGANDEFICRDGEIWLREGDLFVGQLLSGRVRGAAMNAAGELAFLWSVTNLPNPPLQVVYREGKPLAFAGSAVDLDGDGTVDPGTEILSFQEGTLSIGPSGDVYVIARIDDGMGPFDVWLHLPRVETERSCEANLNFSGIPASISVHGSDILSENSLRLRCTGMPRFSFGFFIVSRDLGFVANPGGSAGNLCLGGTIGRFQNQVRNSGAAAVIGIEVDLTTLPQPNGTVAAQVGESWSFSTWFRDIDPMGGVTSNFSDAVTVTLR